MKAKVLEKLHEELNYMAKVMPVNEYRASWLNEVLRSLLQGDCIHRTLTILIKTLLTVTFLITIITVTFHMCF